MHNTTGTPPCTLRQPWVSVLPSPKSCPLPPISCQVLLLPLTREVKAEPGQATGLTSLLKDRCPQISYPSPRYNILLSLPPSLHLSPSLPLSLPQPGLFRMILLVAASVWVSTSSMAVLEPCLPIWLMDTIQ